MKQKITTLKKLITNNLIDNGYFSKKATGRLVVLMYHGIDRVQNTAFNKRFYGLSEFETQVATFKKHFNILSYSDFLSENYSSIKTNILLTFDDGYANNFKYALPVLQKYNAPALFFITGVATCSKKMLWADALDIVAHYGKEKEKITLGNIDFHLMDHKFVNRDANLGLEEYIKSSKKNGYAEKEDLVDQLLRIHDFTKNTEIDDYWQLMTDEQISKSAQSNLITIGSHGFYHNNLGCLSNDDALAEVQLSKQYLEGATQQNISTIGFPDGSYTEQLNESLYNYGFKQQFLVNYRYGDENKRSFVHDRFGLYPGMGNANRLVYKILHQ